MERVTIEHNGERITLEVPDGMSDEDILNFVKSQPADAKDTPKPAEDQSMMNKAASDLREGVYGTAKDAVNWVKENPQTAFDAGTLGVGAYAASKIPGVAPGIKAGAKFLGSKSMELGGKGLSAASQGISKLAGDIGTSTKYYGDVAKQGMSDISRSQVKYPTLGKALGTPKEAVSMAAKAVPEMASKMAPYAQMAAKLGIPLEFLLRSGELNANEEEELAKRRKQGVTLK
jgi:hypothetical protein